MTLEGVIVAILAASVMHHRPSTVERPNWEFASWDFRGRTNKSAVTIYAVPFLVNMLPSFLHRHPAKASTAGRGTEQSFKAFIGVALTLILVDFLEVVGASVRQADQLGGRGMRLRAVLTVLIVS